MDWQPIETAPKDGTEILVYRKRDIFSEHGVSIEYADLADMKKGGTGYDRATHWIPLPPPPSQHSQGE